MRFRLDPLSSSGISLVTTNIISGGTTTNTTGGTSVTLAGEDYLSLSDQEITANPIDLDNLSATGTPSSSTFLRGDNTWATPAGSGDVSKVGTPADNQVGVWTGDGTIEGSSGLTYDGSNLLLAGDIGATGTRITKGWYTDLQVTNAISGGVTGNAGTVTNGVYTTDAGTVFLAPNSPITGATKTKITYDADGLITSGADATTADIAASTDKNYVTDAQLTVLTNTSGTNTGDQDISGKQNILSEGAFVNGDKTKLDGIEALADVTDTTNVTAAGATMDADTSLAGNGYFLDEDNMASDSATKVPSQQSVKAYADTKQPLDSDLTTIAGLTATTDNFLQSKSSAWASRTPAQAAVDLLPYIYPVGCIYTSTNSTNPATSLGFGTWSAFGAGRVPVGFDSGDTDFDTDEETGGAKTVATNVTVATQPTFTVNSHTHPLSNNGQAQVEGTSAGNVLMTEVATGSWNSVRRVTGTAGASASGRTTGAGLAGATDATAGTATTRTADVALTNNATSVVQPYITVRMWKRVS